MAGDSEILRRSLMAVSPHAGTRTRVMMGPMRLRSPNEVFVWVCVPCSRVSISFSLALSQLAIVKAEKVEGNALEDIVLTTVLW